MKRLGIYLTLDGLVLYFENPVTAEAKMWQELLTGQTPRAIIRLGEIDTDSMERIRPVLREMLPPSIMIVTPPSEEESRQKS